MEALPKLQMISFELKTSPEPIDTRNLRRMIAEQFREDPESYVKEFTQFEQLRGVSVRPRIDVECISTLRRYYAHLHSIYHRFPPVLDLLAYVWKEIYSGSVLQTPNIKFEMACILYNIATLHTKLGAEEDRTNPESLKIACTHFQNASWAYKELMASYTQVLRGDLSSEILMFMHQISLAQAQECILEKSLCDNRKPSIIAKVVAQVVNFYNSAMTALLYQSEDCNIQDLVGGKLYKDWVKYIKFKSSYLSCILLLYQGQHSEEQKKMGERVILYTAAVEKLEEAKKEAKGMQNQEVVMEAITFMTDIAVGKMNAAKKENDFIYHDQVPDISNIAAVQGVNLVNGTGFDVGDPEVIGEDIFKRIVPIKIHETSSMYSEEKANVLRVVGEKIFHRNAEVDSYMSSLNIDSLNALNSIQSDRLPQGIVDRCAELSAKPDTISNLVQSMSNLAETCAEVETILNDIRKMLDEESQLEMEYQKKMGQRPTGGHVSELNREFNKYFEAHKKAGESNDTLRKAMELHVNNLKILSCSLSELQEKVPRFSERIDEESVKDLRHLVSKVNEMKEQRKQLYENLREAMNNDDITSVLVAHGNKNTEELYQRELKKHSPTIALLEQNMEAQNNILTALTDTYAKYATLLKQINDMKIKKDQFFCSLIASYDVYEDLLLKSAKGLEFYKKLLANVQKLVSRVKGMRDVQDEERQQMLKSIMTPPTVTPISKSSGESNVSSGGGPKLKDYLKSGMFPHISADKSASSTAQNYGNYASSKNNQSYYPSQMGTGAAAGYTNPIYQNSQYSSAMNYSAQKPDQYQSNLPQTTLSSDTAKPSSDFSKMSVAGYPQTNTAQYASSQYQWPASTVAQQNPTNYSQAAVTANSGSALQWQSQNYQYPTQQTSQYPQTNSQIPGQYPQASSVQSGQQYAQPQASSIQYPVNQPTNPQIAPQQSSYSQYSQPQATTVPYTSYYNSTVSPAATYSYGSQTNPVTSTSSSSNNYSSYYQYPVNQQATAAQSQTNQQYIPQNVGEKAPVQQITNDGMSYNQNATGNYASNQTTAGDNYAAQMNYQYQQLTNAYGQQLNSHVNQSQPKPESYASPAVVQPSPQTNQYPSQVSSLASQMYQNQTVPAVAQSNPANMYSNVNGSGYAGVYNAGFNTNMNYQALQQQQLEYKPASSQQNYFCTTPTINSNNSYSSAYVPVGNTSLTQSNYTYTPSATPTPPPSQNSQVPYQNPQMENISDCRNDTRSTSTLSASQGVQGQTNATNSTQSQIQQISSPIETPKKMKIKSENIDLLSGIDFAVESPSVESVPTLLPQPIKSEPVAVVKEEEKKKEEPPKPEVLTPTKVVSVEKSILDISDELDAIEPAVVVPKKVETLKDIVKNPITIDPFDNPVVLDVFRKEVERLEKFCKTLNIKTLNGGTPLDNKWKEIQDLLVKDESTRSVSVAKLFPDKNRSIDYLPYDHARVLLPTTTDNYINAVYVKDLGPNCPTLILTQTPLNNTVNDYWEMVWSQNSTTLLCLHTPNEILDTFWPQDLNKEQAYGEFSITLMKQFDLSHCLEKYLRITKSGCDDVMNVSLLQIKAWKKSDADQILGIANNVIVSYKQHNLDHKQLSTITINCLTGAERSGDLSVGLATVFSIQSRPVLLNVVDVWYRICSQRKSALNDVNTIKLSLQIVLNNAHNILNKNRIVDNFVWLDPTNKVQPVKF